MGFAGVSGAGDSFVGDEEPDEASDGLADFSVSAFPVIEGFVGDAE